MTDPHAPPLIVDQLHVSLRRRLETAQLLQGVTFSVRRGESVAVIAANRLELDMLLGAILGFLPMHDIPKMSGTISIDGQPVESRGGRRAGVRRRVGVMFRDDSPSFDPSMRVGRQLAARLGRGVDLRAVLDAAGLGGAGRDLQAYPHQMTSEQRQRLALAMALAPAPSLLLLEEPAGTLDVAERAALLRSIAALRDRREFGLLLLTGNIETAALIAGRGLVLHAGRVVETARMDELIPQPAHPFTEALLAARCRIDADRARRRQTAAMDRAFGADQESLARVGCAFRGPCPSGSTRCAQVPPLAAVARPDRLVACWHAAAPTRRVPPPPWPPLAPSGFAPVLRLTDVSHRYRRGAAPALDGVSLHLGDREALAIVGLSGAGKTTLLRIAAGLLRPTLGRRAYPSLERAQMIFRDPFTALPPWRRIGASVAHRLGWGMLSRAEQATRVEEALAQAQLAPDMARAFPRDLTLAQAQRVAIACAMIKPAPMLLCDDPLAMLLGPEAAGVLDVLAGLRRSYRVAMLYATDDIAVARYIADRIIVLERGRIVEQGPAETLPDVAAQPATRTLIAAVAAPLLAAEGTAA